jgi:uroporphyrinogen-III synthase
VTSSAEAARDRPLAGRGVVVTRAAERAGALAARLTALGADVIEVPTVTVVEPADGGAALRVRLAVVEDYDWVVVTSPSGAERVAAAVASVRRARGRVRVGAVGPGTAAALEASGVAADLVAARSVAEGLVDAFPSGTGRVLLAQAAAARPVVAVGLTAKGWNVDAVVAYRTVPARPAPAVVAAARRADAITFTSGSTVTAYLEAAGVSAVPPVVVCIGPITAAAAIAAGVPVRAVADPHTLDGLVAATVEALQ